MGKKEGTATGAGESGGEAALDRWYANTALWEGFAPLIFGDGMMERASDDADQVAALLGLERGDAVLDLCCGIGRHSLALARRGYRVTGVDITPAFLAKAKELADEAGSDIEWVAADMLQFERPGAFDAVLNLSTSLGYFPRAEDDLRALRHAHDSLRHGGRIAIDVKGKDHFIRSFRPVVESTVGNVRVREEMHLSDDGSRVTVKRTVRAGGEEKTFTFLLRLYSVEELTGLLKEAGFTAIEVFGDLAGHPYDDRATRLVVTAKKP